MSGVSDREQHHLCGMIERLQRAGHPEHSIHEAVRQAAGRTPREPRRPVRGGGRRGLLGRLRGR